MMKCALIIASILLAGLTGCGRPPVIVLHQMHTFENIGHVDTLVTYISRDHVRVSYASGDAILDFKNDRMILLDQEAHTYREVSLKDWEAKLREAVAISAERRTEAPPKFERAGQEQEVAGFTCDRYQLYTRREMLPGEVDYVEQQIWVARDLDMPKEAYEAYARAMGSVDSIGLGGLAERPKGVVMQMELRTRRADQPRTRTEVERNRVTRVERIKADASLFAIPSTFRPAPESN